MRLPAAYIGWLYDQSDQKDQKDQAHDQTDPTDHAHDQTDHDHDQTDQTDHDHDQSFGEHSSGVVLSLPAFLFPHNSCFAVLER